MKQQRNKWRHLLLYSYMPFQGLNPFICRVDVRNNKGCISLDSGLNTILSGFLHCQLLRCKDILSLVLCSPLLDLNISFLFPNLDWVQQSGGAPRVSGPSVIGGEIDQLVKKELSHEPLKWSQRATRHFLIGRNDMGIY